MSLPITSDINSFNFYMQDALLTTFKSTLNTSLSYFSPKTSFHPNEQAVRPQGWCRSWSKWHRRSSRRCPCPRHGASGPPQGWCRSSLECHHKLLTSVLADVSALHHDLCHHDHCHLHHRLHLIQIISLSFQVVIIFSSVFHFMSFIHSFLFILGMFSF